MSTEPSAASIPAGLRRIRRDLGLEVRHVATHLGVSTDAISNWDLGHANPPAHQVVAYAALMDRRIMVSRQRQGLYDLAEVLADLGAFRKARRLTQQQVADLMHVSVAGVGQIERRCRYRQRVGWASVVRYFDALGYELGISKVEVKAA
jgi:transcriptional regulator with XRE-family HTH domain